jgi:hypothetical protein
MSKWMVFVFSFTQQGSADYIIGNLWYRQSTTSNSLTLTAAPHSDLLCKYNMKVYITRNWHKKSTGLIIIMGSYPAASFSVRQLVYYDLPDWPYEHFCGLD